MKYCTHNQQRKGTCYFEFQKGISDGNIHWLEDSIYLCADMVDTLGLYTLFQKFLPAFAYYGITIVKKEHWNHMIHTTFDIDKKIDAVFAELDLWAQACFEKEDYFTILGI